jgi:hypothetical protein
MILHGHGVEIRWDGSTLAARGTTSAGREAVHAPEGAERLELAIEDIDAAILLEAPRQVGGVVIIVERSLEEHRLHFRRDTRLEFVTLVQEIEDAVRARPAAEPQVVRLTDSGDASVPA